MEDLTIIALLLYTIVTIGFIMNLVQMYTESRKLKAEGKTPLMKRNMLTIGVATAAELLMVFGAIWLASYIGFTTTVVTVVTLFVAIYLLRNGAAYLAAWGLWTLFIRKDKKQMEKKIEEEQGEAF